MRALRIAVGLIAVTVTGANAQQSAEEKEFLKQQFRGWSGVLLRCALNETHKEIADAICQSASAEFEYLAENSGIPHAVSVNENSFKMYVAARELGTPIILELETLATTGSSSPTAIHVRLQARSFYSNAIDQNAPANSPEASPRPGDLVLWQHPVIGAGYGEQEVVRAIGPYVNENMKRFFTAFLRGWKAQ
jgi:hypothetical protein